MESDFFDIRFSSLTICSDYNIDFLSDSVGKLRILSFIFKFLWILIPTFKFGFSENYDFHFRMNS